MAQGLGCSLSIYGEEDDIGLGFRRYEEHVEHSQNLVIHCLEDDFQDPIQVAPNHQEVPHEEHKLAAREESPVPQQFSQYEDLNQWEYDEENRVEYQESPRQQEPSQQIQHSEDQDYQIEYPNTQYLDEGFLNHQQVPHVVQQQQSTYSHQMMPDQVYQMEHRVDDLSTTQVRPLQQRVQRVQTVNQQHQHNMNLFDAPQPQVRKTGPLFFSPLEHPLNGVSKWKNQQRNQQVLKQGPPQHFQPMKQPEISRRSGKSSQFEQQLAQQARLREAKKLLFPVSFEQEALNIKSPGSGPLKFSPMVHPITKVPYEIPQNVSQLARPTQRVEEMEEPSQTTENPRTRWNRLTEEQKKRSNIKRTENRQKKRIRDAQKAQEEKEKQANDALRKLNCLKKLWPL